MPPHYFTHVDGELLMFARLWTSGEGDGESRRLPHQEDHSFRKVRGRVTRWRTPKRWLITRC